MSADYWAYPSGPAWNGSNPLPLAANPGDYFYEKTYRGSSLLMTNHRKNKKQKGKMKLIVIILIALTCSARASLIDLTPGGFHVSTFPPPFQELLHQQSTNAIWFYDSYQANGGWVSQFGHFNGGVFFTCSITGTTATISWDFTDAGGYFIRTILVEGYTGYDHMYSIPGSDRLVGSGEVTIDGVLPIFDVAFYGKNINLVPDSGPTVGLLALALVGIIAFKLRSRSSPLEPKSGSAGLPGKPGTPRSPVNDHPGEAGAIACRRAVPRF
jgi:hypothetical protein